MKLTPLTPKGPYVTVQTLLLCNSGPLMALGMICFTVISCYLVVHLPKWFK